jgi:allantoicase
VIKSRRARLAGHVARVEGVEKCTLLVKTLKGELIKHIYTHTHTHTHTYIYIYIYRERERERERLFGGCAVTRLCAIRDHCVGLCLSCSISAAREAA